MIVPTARDTMAVVVLCGVLIVMSLRALYEECM